MIQSFPVSGEEQLKHKFSCKNRHSLTFSHSRYHSPTSCNCVQIKSPISSNSLNSIKWASETPNVTRFFPSEYGTDIEHNSRSPNEKPHQLKLKVRAYAKTIPKDKLHFTYLVTGPYSDMYIWKSSNNEISTFDVKAKKAVLLGDGNGKVAFTTMHE